MSSPEARPLRADELPRAAAFLARLNRIPEHHIGFCGVAEAEILDSLQHFGDVPATDAFVVLEQNGNLTGLLGFDADLGRGRAEIWGPFAEPQASEVAASLWQSVRFPVGIREALLFCNLCNVFCADFAARGGFAEEVPTQILRAQRSIFSEDATLSPRRLTAADAEVFTALHDALFPGTYYDGRDILGYLDEHQVLTAHDEAGLCGYVYAEVSPAFGEGSLEFVGVAPRARNKGVGTRLVREALAWVFSSAAVAEVTLVVSTRQEAALRLPRAAGFRLEHETRSFLKTW